jgi:hypothetical protein
MTINIESLRCLQTSLARIDDLIRAAVARAQEAGHDPTDALRGLIISDDEVMSHLSKTSLAGLWPSDEHAPHLPPISLNEDPDHPFLHLIQTFDLTLLDSYILLLCLAPELDRRYERLYAYLHDDVSQRRPTVNLMMNLLGNDVPQRFAVWERLLPENPLLKHHLIEHIADSSKPTASLLTAQIKVDNRVTAHLLGDATIDERLKNIVKLELNDAPPSLPEETIAPIREALSQSPMIFMLGADGMGQHKTAASLCADYELPLISIDIKQLANLNMPFATAWRLAMREAYLINGALLLNNWESGLNEHRQPPLDLWSALVDYQKPVFLCGERDWEPLDTYRTRRLLRMTFAIPAYSARHQVWQQFTQGKNVHAEGEDIAALASKFRFTRNQIARAVHTSLDIAQSQARPVTVTDLYAGAQAHAGLRLGHLAKRIIPHYNWGDLILPDEQVSQLFEMTAWARFAHVVNDDWGFGKKIAHVTGVSALFAGESGTGKTLAAEVIANDLGLVLYKIDLSAVVSKYIGETEKNLGTIFTEARSGNAILFFDEADAIFGKRSEVKDSRDRYANIEVAYLLQEIEAYDGIAILATNLRQNLDEAFTRRIDFLIDFPFPESEHRRQMWSVHFPPEAPVAPDIDLDDLAERYRLAGGNIRNVVIGAAYLAAADGDVITHNHMRKAIRREHQKMGRLLDDTY